MTVADADVCRAFIGVAQRGVGDVIQHQRDVVMGVEAITDGYRFPKEDRTAQLLHARFVGGGFAVVDRAAEARLQEEGTEDVPTPGQPEIGLAGVAARIDAGTDMRSRRPDHLQEFGGDEKQLGVDIEAVLLRPAEHADIMRQTAEAHLREEARHGVTARCRETGSGNAYRREQNEYSRTEEPTSELQT